MFVTSRWFPSGLALLQTLRHVALISFGYWAAEQNERRFDAVEFIRADLARPFFEPYAFCGAWTHYSGPQSAAISLDLPPILPPRSSTAS